jgi:hypothetical protein
MMEEDERGKKSKVRFKVEASSDKANAKQQFPRRHLHPRPARTVRKVEGRKETFGWRSDVV